MENYRFRLQKYVPNNKVTCPSCKRRRCAVKYIDTQGEIVFPDNVCICDHANSCGYHYPPKEYFHDNPDVLKELLRKENPHQNGGATNNNPMTNSITPSSRSPPDDCVMEDTESLPVSFVDTTLANKTLTGYGINPLFRFLSKKYGEEDVRRIFLLYHVGTSRQWNGATVYWYTDVLGNFRTGKVMGYDPDTGHRIKQPYNQVSWVHSLLKLKDFNMKLCLFGEHLLPLFPEKKVALVEAEKTCLVAAHFLPDYLWLATGGLKMGFKTEVMKVLSGRDVTLFPDLGAYEEWNRHLPLIKSICKKVTVSHYLEDIATEEQRKRGLDIGDFLLRDETKREILKRMIQHNPSLQLLIEKLKLELVEDN